MLLNLLIKMKLVVQCIQYLFLLSILNPVISIRCK